MVNRPIQIGGVYHLKEGDFEKLTGSRTQVMNKTAFKTSGGLTMKDLLFNKWGRIVSAKKHKTAKKEKRLEKHGYFAKKGKFGYVKKSVRNTKKNKSKRNKSKKNMKGGSSSALAPAEV